MSRFNLLDEPWIPVIVDDKGNSKLASLLEIFRNAQDYKALAGDMRTQDFAIMRVLLAILHTTFSRYDAEGNERTFDSDDDDEDDYNEESMEIWNTIWKSGCFPNTIAQYLEQWRDRFFLFDDTHPFYQVIESDIASDKLAGKEPSIITGANINRLISESGNKIALFSPKCEGKNNKDLLSEDQLARWIITLQGYSGLSDKRMFGEEKYKSCKGWLFDLGGILLCGKNLFETLMLNTVMVHAYQMPGIEQKPCWEYTSNQVITNVFVSANPSNLAQLYTRWSRALYLDPTTDVHDALTLAMVKLPDIDHQNAFIEPMTLWRYNIAGDNKDTFTPRKHRSEQALWRSFGLLTLSESLDKKEPYHVPELMKWLNILKNYIPHACIAFQSISMKDDGNATSWVPVDEISDALYIDDLVVTDNSDDGWVYRINTEIDYTKQAIDKYYRLFLKDIAQIRNSSDKSCESYCATHIDDLYFQIDDLFREWLIQIKPEDSKNERCDMWRNTLYRLMSAQARAVVQHLSIRDLTGKISSDDANAVKYTNNIITAYNHFFGNIRKLLQQSKSIQ